MANNTGINARGKGKPFVKGNTAAAGRGPNKISKTVKETVLAVFNQLQGEAQYNLTAFAKKNTKEFYAIAAKLIPTEVQATVDASVIWKEEKTYEVKPETDESS